MRTYSEYGLVNNESDVISLTQIIREICYRQDREMYKPQAILFSVKAVNNFLQLDSSNIDYYKKIGMWVPDSMVGCF